MAVNRFAELESSGLGLVRDGRIILMPHNGRWASEYSIESQRILSALDEPSIQIFHIGSTSIPGIQAKPILDLLMATPTLKLLDSRLDIFRELGYESKGEYGQEGRRYYVLADQKTNKAYVHLHAWEEDRNEILRHLLFRDYLRYHPSDAKKYDAVKSAAVQRADATRTKYMDLKTPVIEEIMSAAAVWASTPEARSFCTEWQLTDN